MVRRQKANGDMREKTIYQTRREPCPEKDFRMADLGRSQPARGAVVSLSAVQRLALDQLHRGGVGRKTTSQLCGAGRRVNETKRIPEISQRHNGNTGRGAIQGDHFNRYELDNCKARRERIGNAATEPERQAASDHVCGTGLAIGTDREVLSVKLQEWLPDRFDDQCSGQCCDRPIQSYYSGAKRE